MDLEEDQRQGFQGVEMRSIIFTLNWVIGKGGR